MTIEKADVYFLDGEFTVAGQFGSTWTPEPGSTNPPPVSDLGFAFTRVLWKEKSTSDHPNIGNGDLTGRFQRIGDKGVFLQIEIEMGSTTTYGPGKNYWYLQPLSLMPDFAGEAIRSVGSAWAWDQKADEWYPGACWWTDPGGQLLYGVRCAFGKNVGFSRNNPFTWAAGSRLLVSIHYELP